MVCVLNGKEINISAPSVLIAIQDCEVFFKEVGEKAEVYTMSTTSRFGSTLHLDVETISLMYLSFRERPYVKMSKKQMDTLTLYFSILKSILQESDNPYRSDATIHLTLAFLYGIGYHLHKSSLQSIPSEYSPLTSQLLSLVKENYTVHRKISFYADEMKMTPRYLSHLLKVETGKSITQWINEFTLQEASFLLLKTNITIAQVSDRLGFPNQSFFGKYFKQHVGMSPKAYRK